MLGAPSSEYWLLPLATPCTPGDRFTLTSKGRDQPLGIVFITPGASMESSVTLPSLLGSSVMVWLSTTNPAQPPDRSRAAAPAPTVTLSEADPSPRFAA